MPSVGTSAVIDLTDRKAGRALVVDDDPMARKLVSLVLEQDGWEVFEAADTAGATTELRRERPDLIVLDVQLPGGSGFDLLADLRKHSEVPVIFVSGRDDEAARIQGLDLGGDDFLVKPFSPDELSARVRAVNRRLRGRYVPHAEHRLVFGELALDLASRQVFISGTEVELTAREFNLLAFLATSPRQVFSRSQLLEHVWGSSSNWQSPATVTEHVRRLRSKIETDPESPRWVRTARGVGYRFEP